MMKKFLSVLLCVMIAVLPLNSALASALMLPAALTSIEAEAFEGDAAIGGNLELPDNVESVGDRAFKDTNVYALWLPDGIREVGSDVLAGTDAVYAVVPNADASLDADALTGAHAVITSGDGAVKQWAEEAGMPCYLENEIMFQDGFCWLVENDEATLLFGETGELSGDIVVPTEANGFPVVAVSAFALSRQDGVTSLSVPDSVNVSDVRENWPDIEIEKYYTGVQPILPDNENAVELEMDVEDGFKMNVGDEWHLEVIDWPEERREVIWKTTDSGIVDVDEEGNIRATGLGKAAVSVIIYDDAEEEAWYAVCQISVVEPSVKMYVEDVEMSIPVGRIVGFSYWFEAEGIEDNVVVSIEAEDNGVLEMVDEERFIGVSAGTAKVTYTATLGDISDTVETVITVYEPELTLDDLDKYLLEGEKAQLSILDEIPEDAVVEWSSDNEDAVMVDENGIIWSVGVGAAYITCTVTYADGTTKSADCLVRALETMFYFREITEDVVLVAGDVVPECYPVLYRTSSPDHDWDNVKVTAVSSDDEILSIDDELVGTAHKAGRVEITVHAEYYGMTADSSFFVTVEAPEIEVELHNEDEMELNVGDDNRWLETDWHTNREVTRMTFSSSDESVVRVGTNGLLIPVGEGSAEVTFTVYVGKYSASDSIIVHVYGATAKLTPAEVTLQVGESTTVSASVSLPEGVKLSEGYGFFSTNEEIANVDDKGLVTGLSAGTVRIVYESETDQGSRIFGFATVHVEDANASLKLNASSITLSKGDSYQLEALLPEGAEVLSWTTSNPDCVRVDENGLVKCNNVWNENLDVYVTCTALVDGEEVSASCMVILSVSKINLELPAAILIGEEPDGFWYELQTGADGKDYDVTFIIEDEEIATIDRYNMITPVSEGATKLIASVYDNEGLVLTREVPVYVQLIPVVEDAEIEQDIIYVNPDDNDGWFGPNIRLYPDAAWEYTHVYLTSSDEDIVATYDDTLEMQAVGSGHATVTMHVVDRNGREIEELKDTVEVYAFPEPYFEIDKTLVGMGETVTVTVRGIPDDFEHVDCYWDWDDHHFRFVSETENSLTLRARANGETGIHAWIDIAEQYGVDAHYDVSIEGEEAHTNLASVDMNPGEEAEIWPEVHYDRVTWSSDNEDVAYVEVDEEGRAWLIAENPGTTVINAFCERDDGSEFYVYTDVRVNERSWKLNGIDMHPILILGEEYEVQPDLECNGMYWPEWIVWTFDGNIAGFDENGVLHADGVGSFNLTVTVREGDHEESFTQRMTITNPRVRMDQAEYETRPGESEYLEIRVGGGMPAPESIRWFSSDPSKVQVDEDGWATVLADEGRVQVYAEVCFPDTDIVYTAAAWIYIIPDGEIWFDIWAEHDPVEMFTGDVFDLKMFVDTNAWDEEVYYEWESMNPDVIALSTPVDENGEDISEDNSIARVTAVGAGETQIRFTAYAAGGEREETKWINAYVIDREVHAYIDNSYIELNVGENAWVECHYDASMPADRTVFTSSDESVVRVTPGGMLIPVGIGSAKVYYTVYMGDLSSTAEMHINVRGMTAQLTPEEVTIAVGESVMISAGVTLPEGYEQDWSYRDLWSSNEDIAIVNHEGMVTGLSAGTVWINYRSSIPGNGNIEGHAIVHVVDENAAVKLNADCIELALNESFQMDAEFSAEPESVVWSVNSNHALEVDQNGRVTLIGFWDEYNPSYVTCTAVINGEEVSASCLVRCDAGRTKINGPWVMIMGVNEGRFFNYEISDDEDNGDYILTFEIEDETIAVLENEHNIRGISSGETKLFVRVFRGDELLSEKIVPVYVDAELPGIESISINQDYYVLGTGDTDYRWTNADVAIYPILTGEYHRVFFTSSDEDIVRINGNNGLEGVNAGTATITMHVEGPDGEIIEELTDTAEVYVFERPVIECEKIEEGVEVGETFTIRVNNLPDDYHYAQINWSWDENGLSYVSETETSLTLRARDGGNWGINVEIGLDDQTGYGEYFEMWISGDSHRLSLTEVNMNPGETLDVWTEFDVEGASIEWISSNADVAVVEAVYEDDPFRAVITAMGEGICEIQAALNYEDGRSFVVPVDVRVNERSWELEGIDLYPAVVLGEVYELNPVIRLNGAHYPEMEWSADSDIVEIFWDEESDRDLMRVNGTGIVNLTVTMREGDHVESVSQRLTATEPLVGMEQAYYELRPGANAQLNVVASEAMPEIASIRYHSLDENRVIVDETGAITIVGHDGEAWVAADVTFEDMDTVYSAVACVHILQDHEIWLEVNRSADHFDLFTGEEADVWVNVDTNAAEHEIDIEWGVYDGYHANLYQPTDDWGTPLDPSGCSMRVVGGNEGYTRVYCTVRIGGFMEETVEFGVQSMQPFVDAYFEGDYYREMRVGDDNCWANGRWDACLPEGMDVEKAIYSTNNPSVVRITSDGLMIPVGQGEAQIQFEVTAGDLKDTEEMTVRVYGGTAELTPDELTIAVGESAIIAAEVYLQDGAVQQNNHRSFRSSDENIAIVNHEGMVTGLSAGSVQITYESRTQDGNPILGYATVRVVDEGAPIRLNATSIRLNRSESFRLEADFASENVESISWTSSNPSVTVDETGKVYMRHIWDPDMEIYVTCTAIVDGKEASASCLVLPGSDKPIVEHDAIISLSEGDEWYFNYRTLSNYGADFRVELESEDTEVITIGDDYLLTAVGAGITKVLVKAYDGETLVYEGEMLVYVDVERPAVERVEIGDYSITMRPGDTVWPNGFIYPVIAEYYTDIYYTSSNDDVFFINEDGQLQGAGAGRAEVTMHVRDQQGNEIEGMTDTMEVFVFDEPEIKIDRKYVNTYETVTLSVEGIPEDYEFAHINWQYDEHHFHIVSETETSITLRARFNTQTWVGADVHLHNYNISAGWDVTIEGEEYSIDFRSVYLNPGETMFVHPEFDTNGMNFYWSTSNEDVAVAEADDGQGRVTAMGVGSCVVYCNLELEDRLVSVPVDVIVRERSWEITDIDLYPALIVDRDYDLRPVFEMTGFYGPEVEWSVESFGSQEDLAEIRQDDDGQTRMHTYGEGMIAVTAHAFDENIDGSVTKLFWITRPAVYAEREYYDIRPGQAAQMVLMIEDGREVSNVSFSSADHNKVYVDEAGMMNAWGDEGDVQVTARVTFADSDEVHVAICWVHIVTNDELYLNAFPSTENHIEIERDWRHPVWLNVDTNAAPSDISIEWWSDDEGVAAVVDHIEEDGSINNHDNMMRDIEGRGDGETTIHARIRVADRHEQEFEFRVSSKVPYLNVGMDYYQTEMSIHDDNRIVPLWIDTNRHVDSIAYRSDDPSVAVVTASGLIRPLSQGGTNVYCTVYAGEFEASTSFRLDVYGSTMAMNPAELTIGLGESATVAVDVADRDAANNRHYYSADESIAFVDHEGVVTGLSAGSTYIYLNTSIEYIDTIACTLVHVVDDASPIKLNEKHIRLGLMESFQLEAEFSGEAENITWTSDDGVVRVDENGLVQLIAYGNSNMMVGVTCTAEINGETVSAKCMVQPDADKMYLEMGETMFFENVGDVRWIDYVHRYGDSAEECEVVFTIENEEIASYNAETNEITANAQGVTAMRAQLVNGEGEVIYSRIVNIYVMEARPEVESLHLFEEFYLVGSQNTDFRWGSIGAEMYPQCAWEYTHVWCESGDENILKFNDEWNYEGVNPGTTEIYLFCEGMNLDEEGNEMPVDSATVVVYDGITIQSNYEYDSYYQRYGTLNTLDTITFTFEGIPEYFADNYWIEWELDESAVNLVEFTENSVTLRARRYGQFGNMIRVRLGEVASVDFDCSIYAECDDRSLNNNSLIMNPGEISHQIGPNFEMQSITSWTTSNEDVATVAFDVDNWSGIITAVAPGSCQIWMEGIDNNGNTITTCVDVIVVDRSWYINGMHLPTAMVLGSEHDLNVDIVHNGVHGPQTLVWTIDEGEGKVAEITEEGRVRAIGVGEFTLTVQASYSDTLEGAEDVQSYSWIFTVTQPPVYFENNYIEMRPGFSRPFTLVTAEGRSIESVEWSLPGEGANIDENGVVTVESYMPSGDYIAQAKVILDDGSVHYINGFVHVINDDELYFNFEIEGNEQTIAVDEEGEIRLHIDTNAEWEEYKDSFSWNVGEHADFVDLGEGDIGRNMIRFRGTSEGDSYGFVSFSWNRFYEHFDFTIYVH